MKFVLKILSLSLISFCISYNGSHAQCLTFADTENGEKGKEAHIIYKDYLKLKDYDTAFEYWQQAYTIAPAADGRRHTHYADGILFYEHFLKTETDSTKRDTYIRNILRLYDEIATCYSSYKGYVQGRKGMDLYYYYPEFSSPQETYDLLKSSIETDSTKAPYFVLYPLLDLSIQQFKNQKIQSEEALKNYRAIYAAYQFNIAHNKKEKASYEQAWKDIWAYLIPPFLTDSPSNNFFDCEFFELYYNMNAGEEDNRDVFEVVYGGIKRQENCNLDSDFIASLETKKAQYDLMDRKEDSIRMAKDYPINASKAYKSGRHSDAIDLFEKAIGVTGELDKKAEYSINIAKIYYRDIKDYPKSRAAALQAAKFRPNWGEPYLLIGDLYASSGPLCGPGTGWDSQIVTWVAIDQWKKAKKIDPNSSKEADSKIAEYTRYMPTKGDIHMRSLQEGQSYRVECWIKESTTIRGIRE